MKKPATEAEAILARARSKADDREANRQPIDYPAMNKMVKRQRAALTRAANSKSADLVVLACREAVQEWNAAGAAWPDDWSRWQRALDDILPWGKRVSLEDLAGELPAEPKPKKAKKAPAWVPKERNPLEMSPVVEKFVLWRHPPLVRPTAKGITQTRLDRYIRMALVGKRTNWYADWGKSWGDLARSGVTDEELMAIVVQEFGTSSQRNPQDKRRVVVDFWRKGKKAWFVVGAADDPDKIELTGLNLLAAVRRAMKISPLTRDAALAMQEFIASFTLPTT